MRKAIIVAGMMSGDESKGSIVDYLTRQYNSKWNVRYSGGGQASHNVVLPNGLHHAFHQFGSGTFAGARTHLSRGMIIDPITLIKESNELREKGVNNPNSLITIDENCVISTYFHQLANKIIELNRGNGRHSSCAFGVWEAMKDSLQGISLRAGDLINKDFFVQKLFGIIAKKYNEVLPIITQSSNSLIQDLAKQFEGQDTLEYVIKEYSNFATNFHIVAGNDIGGIFEEDGVIIFEGAQGVLLDKDYGFQPYTTGTTVTFDNALELLDAFDYSGEVIKLGLTRSYMTRHGKGPMPTESSALQFSEPHNCFNEWQREFRQGWLDLPLLKYAIDVCGGVDYLAVSHLDYTDALSNIKVCNYYYSCDSYSAYNNYGLTKSSQRGQKLYQEQLKLTKYLSCVKPHYKEIESNELCGIIETSLSKKIAIKSFGPTYKDKTMVIDL